MLRKFAAWRRATPSSPCASSNIIYQTTVPPGPFTLQDVYPSGYGSDLEVSVKEADGSVEVFSVPYASVAQLLRRA